MSSEWPIKQLQQVAREVTVGYVGPMASEYVETGIPLLRSLNIEPFGVNTNDLKFITPDFHQRIRKSSLRPGDVAIVRTGKPGTCAVIPDWLADANCSDLVIVRCGDEIRPHFLCYWVNSIASHHISSHTVGAVQQHFNVGAAKTMNVAVPPLVEQDRVLGVLRALDSRITLLRETNATLEAIAQALFKSWFVDFDPVRAKAEGRQPEGMDPATAALFPATFEDSELGPIPKGWSIAHLGGQCRIEWGNTTITKKSYVASGVKAFSAAGQDGYVEHAERKGVGTVISAIGTVGVVHLAYGEWTAIKNTLTAQCETDPESAYLHFLLRRTRFPSRGSTQQFISLNDARGIQVISPPRALRAAAGAILLGLIDKFVCNSEQVGQLVAVRDLLLPRLISGQLRLPEAEAKIEQALA